VLSGLHHLAKVGDEQKHRKLLVNCVGHLAVAPSSHVREVYRQAISIAWGAKSLDGLESILLIGIQGALAENDRFDIDLALSTLAAFATIERPRSRPIVFLDRDTSMLTVLSPDEYVHARKAILATRRSALLAWGIGSAVRSFDASPEPAATFDQGTCRAWVNGILIVGGVILVLAAPPGWGFGGGVIARILTGGSLGSIGGNTAGPLICSGLSWIGGRPDSDVNGAFIAPSDAGMPGPKQENVEGDVQEGDGFTAVQVNGPTDVTLTGSDGTNVNVNVDGDGITTVTTTDNEGNTTDVTSYDPQGNSSGDSSGGDDGPPPDEGGYPTPDGDGGSGPLGPFGPAALTARLVAQAGPSVGGLLTGRGTTFLLSGLSRGATLPFSGSGVKGFSR